MSKKLLLVDDDTLVLATFGRGLRDAGYEVLVAATGEEALKMVNQDCPDLAILDIRMPGISGIELSGQFNQLKIPVVHLSAYDDPETLQAALKQGALGYLVKPIDAAKAVPTIETALTRAAELWRLQESEGRLHQALDTANVVNFSVGIISERHRIDRRCAFDLMRNQARSERRKVKEIAREILDASDCINRFGNDRS